MLPSTILDLSALRVSCLRHRHATGLLSARPVHQATQATLPTPPPLPYDLSNEAGQSGMMRYEQRPQALNDAKYLAPLPTRIPSPFSELENRVKTLKDIAVEASGFDPPPIEGPSLTEENLLEIYEDLLAHPEISEVPAVPEVIDIEAPQDEVSQLMAIHAENGDVAAIEQVMSTRITGFPTERQCHLHIKAHLKATPLNTIPTSALQVLHSYEDQSHPPAMHTYTSVITSLFASNSSIGRAQAWDLYSHMRYVAHPYPDVPLYTLMIRACASPINTSRASSEPEKALDLWTEMTMDRRLRPSSGAYDAIILACARSGNKPFVGEAFRLVKEMLDSHRDARGDMAYQPSRRTFCALLEGAKRVGDLARARWILAEMVKDHGSVMAETPEEAEGANEEVMMHVFHAYAAYRPPFQRSAAKHVTDGSGPAKNQDMALSNVELPASEKNLGIAALPTASFTHIPPQTHQEVIHEASALFHNILHDTGRISTDSADRLPVAWKFKDVQLTPRLLNSYLSVYYNHASLVASRNLYFSVFEELEVAPTARTCAEALERCANAKNHEDERPIALEFAEKVWTQWKTLEDKREADARMIEKAYTSMIRVLCLTNHTDRALQLVREFTTRYPPSDVASPPLDCKPAFRATRTALVGQRPLVRMSSSVEIPDDHVPPLFMFRDLELLHHRLVARGETKAIGYLKYLTKAYEWALRKRRDRVLRQKPQT